MLDDADLAELEELDVEVHMLAELDAAEQMRDEDDSCSLASSDEEEGRREDGETPILHALKASSAGDSGAAASARWVDRPAWGDCGVERGFGCTSGRAED
jgi:hypothetical protein